MPKLTRRNFLKIGAAAGTLFAGGAKTLHAMELKLGGEDRHQIRPFSPRATYNYVCSLCPYHDTGIAFVEDGKAAKLEGNPDHIATRGKFCPKGMAGLLAAYDPDRLLYPLKRTGQRGSGQWKRITWDEAIKEAASRIKTVLDSGAANEIVLNTGEYKGSALLRFMQTIGSDSVFRSRASSLSNPNKKRALEDAVGVDTLTPDFANARYVLNFGANIVETAFPFAQRLTDGIVEKRLKLVTFDVRLSNTAGRSDEWFPIFPGTDGIVMLAIANVIMSEGLADIEFLKNWTNVPIDKLAAHLKQFTPETAETSSGVKANDVKRVAIEFAETKPNVVFTQNGITYHSNGTLQERAAILLSVITASIDAKGGLCLPRKFDVKTPEFKGSRVQGFKDAGSMNYTLPFKIKDGIQKVSVLLNYMSNPAYSSPAASVWRDVLKDEKLVPFIVDFSPFMSETAELADIILPDVVSVERHDVASSPTALKPWASISTPFLKPQGEAMDVRMTLQKIAKAIDPDGKGIGASWDFKDEADYVKRQVEEMAAIKDKYEDLTKTGMYPVYGKLDSKGRKIIDENGKAVEGEFLTYKKKKIQSTRN
ncbi:MAG: molybdopterin-dependent oxidoreductase [Deltaproteobacteria bacterium]|nr:molybdopterin-dependent oxidoreductase [Deltaproteobacteria bacterium]